MDGCMYAANIAATDREERRVVEALTVVGIGESGGKGV